MLNTVCFENTLAGLNIGILANNIAGFRSTLGERVETRINLQITLYIRRSINHPSYLRIVKTQNVSDNGACFSSNIPLEEGAELYICGLKGQFSGTAIVRHCSPGKADNWLIGIEIISKSGKWVVSTH